MADIPSPKTTQTIEGLTLAAFKASVADAWRPRPEIDMHTFLPQTVRFPNHWETTQFDFDSQPYCRGVIDLFWNDETKRKAHLRWASRLGKTSLVISLIIGQVAADPCPMALHFPDNGERDRSIDNQVYPILDATRFTSDQIPPDHLRNRKAIRFHECSLRLSSGGEKSSVSGFPARRIFKVEVNKNPTHKSSEADPALRIETRAGGFDRGVKILEEGTPSDMDTCRGHELEKSPDTQILHYHVPCPHCGEHQVLQFEQLRWEKDSNGKSSKDLALKTAYYECEHCQGQILDHHRPAMLQAGRWLAKGQSIDKRGHVSGSPAVESDTQLFELSALNSLLISGWGILCAEFVDADNAAKTGKLAKLRKYWNEVLARVWDPAQRKTKPNAVATRLRCDDHQTLQTLPHWTSFTTFTCDCGKIGEELVFYWMVMAWGSPFTMPRGAIVDWGITEGKQPFLKEWQSLRYPIVLPEPRNPKPETLVPVWGQPAAIDSGDFTKEIYDLCSPIRNCWPLKGDSRRNTTDLYALGYAKAGLTPRQIAMKKKMSRPDLFEPSSDVTQGWRQALVEGRTTSADPGFVSLPADVCDQWEQFRDFLDELTCDQLIDGKWQGDDNEFGDTLRYGRALAECYVHGKYRGNWKNLPLIQAANQQGTSGLFSRRSGGSQSERFV